MDEPRKVVLIVDDEAGIRDMLRWFLRGSGYDIEVARDGAEAAEILASERVDIVITDLTMPRVDGFGLLRKAADARSNTPVIVVTGFGTVEMAVHAMRLGAEDFLLKPFDPQRLADRIKEVLESRRGPFVHG